MSAPNSQVQQVLHFPLQTCLRCYLMSRPLCAVLPAKTLPFWHYSINGILLFIVNFLLHFFLQLNYCTPSQSLPLP